MTNPDEVAAGRPVLLRGGTVLTMDDAHTILADADVLVTGDRIAAVGPRLEAPDGALGVDRGPCLPVVLRPAPRVRHAGLPDRLRRHRGSVLPGEAGVRGGPRAGPARHYPRRRLGCHQRRRHPADARERVHDPGERLRARGYPEHGLLPAHRRYR